MLIISLAFQKVSLGAAVTVTVSRRTFSLRRGVPEDIKDPKAQASAEVAGALVCLSAGFGGGMIMAKTYQHKTSKKLLVLKATGDGMSATGGLWCQPR